LWFAAAQEATHRTIEETQIIRLSVEDQRALAEASSTRHHWPLLWSARSSPTARSSRRLLTDVFKIEALGPSHDRAALSSGVFELDRYLREFASQDIRRRISNCFVAVDAIGKIAGYYTFAATSVPLSELPSEQARRLPRYPVLPACLIGRLAIDEASGKCPNCRRGSPRHAPTPPFLRSLSMPKMMSPSASTSTIDFAASPAAR
jgi:hypothetical protein